MTPSPHDDPRRAPRFSGWRAWVLRLTCLLLTLNFVLPHAAIAATPTAGDLLAICTTEVVTHLPADAAGGETDKSKPHAAAKGEHCPACRLAGGAPVLPVPDFVAHTPQSIVETIALFGAHDPAPQPAHPPGSLLARAPPLPV